VEDKTISSEHLAKMKEGVETWNKWRRENPNLLPNLCEANLPRGEFSEGNLRKANLRGADLRSANLRGASLQEVDLRGVNL